MRGHRRLARISVAICLLCTRVDAVPELLDRIVAVVDDQIVLLSELNLRLQMELQAQGRNPMFLSESEAASENARILNEMVDELVVVKKAEKDSIQADASLVEEHLDVEFNNIKRRIGETELANMLERSGMTERQLKHRYRKQIRHRLLFEQMVSEMAYRQFITRRDVEAFRDSFATRLPPKVSVSQINLKVTPADSVLERARAQIAVIEQALDADTDGDFTAIARRFSEDPGTAPEGGDVGCFSPGSLMPEFEQAAFNLKPGERSEAVLTAMGFHLILLHEKRESEMCASHILVRARITEADRQRVEDGLQDLRRRSLSGEDFAQLARDHSQDAGTASQGGLWRILDSESIEPFLVPHVTGLGLGDVSQPFFIEDGGHILKINDDYATLESLVREERVAERMEQLIEDYRREIHVEERLEESWLWDPLETADSSTSQPAPDAALP